MPFDEKGPDTLPSESILREILASVTDGVVTVAENHKVVYCNKSAEQMFGYCADEIIGRDVSIVIPDPHRSLHRQYVQRYIDTRVPRVIGKARECHGRRKDGTIFPVEISYSVSGTTGQLYFTAVIRDITHRKEMEHEVRFMEKLADIGKAVTHVVHEIRKPLMLIGGFASQVERCQAIHDSEKDRRKLQIVVEEVRRLDTLLSGIRLITRPPSSSMKYSIPVNRVLNETLELLEPMLKSRKIEVTTDLTEDPIMVHGDPDQLKQVFLNLLENAISAMKGLGKVFIASRAGAATAQIIVEDNGPGIPPEHREKVFDPFFTTSPEGTGLGLAICRNIVRDHGGDITLQSAVPRGARFVVELPLEGMAMRE